MIRILFVLTLVVGLAFGWAPSGHAAPAPAPLRSDADVLNMLNRLVDWGQPSTRLIQTSQAVTLEMIDAAAIAIRPDSDSVENLARIKAWRARSAAAVGGLRAEAAALRPAPPELLATIRSAGPVGVRQAAGISQVTQLARKLSEDTALQVELMTPLILKASDGDQQAKALLGQRTVIGIRLMLEGENTMLDLGIVMSGKPDHPQADLNLAARASNEALIEALKYYEKTADGEPASATDAAAAMELKLASAREAARSVWPRAQGTTALIAGVPKGELRTRLETAIGSYKESGQIELDIAELLSGAAKALAAGDPKALDQPGLEALVNRRLALANQRRALFNTP